MNKLTERTAIRELLSSELNRAPDVSDMPPLPVLALSSSPGSAQWRSARQRPIALSLLASLLIAVAFVGFRLARSDTHSVVTARPITAPAPTTAASPTPTVEPRATDTTAVSAPVDPASVIPPPEGSSDTRLPLARFLGVPADATQVARWDARLEQNAIKACVEAHGFEYQVQPYAAASAPAVDPNTQYLDSLPAAQQSQYRALLGIEGSYESSCLGQASDRVHPLNTMSAEFAPYMGRYNADPRITAAQAVIAACIKSHGQDPTQQSESQAECAASADWESISSEVESEVETAFILDYLPQLQAFRANLIPLEY